MEYVCTSLPPFPMNSASFFRFDVLFNITEKMSKANCTSMNVILYVLLYTGLKDEMHNNVNYMIKLIQIDLDMHMIHHAFMLRVVFVPTISNNVHNLQSFIETWIRCATVTNLN
eukprot:496524_1